MEAWLEAYHHTPAGGHIIDFGQLDARGGAIQVFLERELRPTFARFYRFLSFSGCVEPGTAIKQDFAYRHPHGGTERAITQSGSC